MRRSNLLSSIIFVAIALGTPVWAGGGPSNDSCAGATPVAVGSTAGDSTSTAYTDGAPFCGTGNVAPGVWFSVTGDGTTLTASTCETVGSPAGSADFDTKISVYCGSCSTPICVGGNDDAASCNFHSAVSWCSEAGADYRILVHGFGSATGNFVLGVSSDSTACTGGIECSGASLGACCDYGGFDDPSLTCSETDEASCASAGGVFHGEGSTCSDFPDSTSFTSGTICAENDFFSTRTSHYAGSTLVEQYKVYSVSIFGPPISQFASFVTSYQGIDALDVQADWTVVFSTYLTPAVNPTGLRHENAYHYHPTSNTFDLVFDGRALGLRSLDAIDALSDGSFAFSTATDQPLGAITLRDENVYRFTPPSTVELLFDGQAIGLQSLDAVDVLPDGRIAFSTAAGQSLRTASGVIYLQDRNVYVWEPIPTLGTARAAGNAVLAFDGLSIGIVNLDAISLARGIEPAALVCF